MTKVLVGKSHLFVSNGLTIAAFNLKGKEDVVILEIPWISQSISQGNQAQPAIGGSEMYDDELSKDSSSCYILQMSICQCGYHLAACNEQKQLVVWDVGHSFEVVCIRSVIRKALCICFLPGCKQLLVADKTGDVYQFETDTRSCYGNTPDTGILLLGHLSMILDMALTVDNKFLITCDRDEKIRVSCYPNCYNIFSFCCGHKEFVVKLALLPNNSTLVSGSGDGTVRFWNYKSGKELFQLKRSSDGEGESESLAVKSCVCSKSVKPALAVVYCGCPSVYVHRIQLDTVSCFPVQQISMDTEPWDICFDEDGALWVFAQHNSAYITKYKANDEGKFVLCDDPHMQAINAHSKFFQATTDGCSLIPILFKRSLDNANEDYEDDSQSTSNTAAHHKRQKTA